MVEDENSGLALFRHFSEVVRRFLPIQLTHLGSVPRDDHVRDAVFRKRCCLEAYPESRASAAFTRIARPIADTDVDRKSVGSGKSGAGRVDLGGRGIIQKKNKKPAKTQ